MVNMVSMKLSPKDAKAETAFPMGKDKGPKYPYCLKLYLDDETLKKLKLDGGLKAGTVVMLEGKAEVTGYSMRESQGGNDQSLELQITDLMATPEEAETGLAAKMYSNPPKNTPYGK